MRIKLEASHKNVSLGLLTHSAHLLGHVALLAVGQCCCEGPHRPGVAVETNSCLQFMTQSKACKSYSAKS